jgi:PST family polysaccharide transporter
MYDDHRLVGLILVLAATAPFTGLDIVPDARLTSEMRFRYLAIVKWITAVGTMGLSILFAHWHWGAYSFVLPQPIITVLRLALLWGMVRWPIRRDPHLRRWRFLFTDSAMLFLANFFIMLTWQGDYIILGIMHDAKTVGIYFFAFNLSIQTMAVFTNNLAGVLFPALSRLQGNVVNQTRAFLRAAKLLAVVGVPLCLLQAALAGPAMAVVFNSWWYPAIRVLQLLSIGMAIRLVASPGGSLLQAQGRFRVYLLTNALNAVFFLSLVAAGSYFGHGLQAARYVAAAVMTYFAIIGPIFMRVAIHPGGGKWRDVWRVYAAPVAASAFAVGGAAVVGRLVPPMHSANARQLTRIATIVGWSIAFYVPMIRYLAGDAVEDLAGRIGGLWRRGAPLPPAPSPT